MRSYRRPKEDRPPISLVRDEELINELGFEGSLSPLAMDARVGFNNPPGGSMEQPKTAPATQPTAGRPSDSDLVKFMANRHAKRQDDPVIEQVKKNTGAE